MSLQAGGVELASETQCPRSYESYKLAFSGIDALLPTTPSIDRSMQNENAVLGESSRVSTNISIAFAAHNMDDDNNDAHIAVALQFLGPD
jgi:hypothetical protein